MFCNLGFCGFGRVYGRGFRRATSEAFPAFAKRTQFPEFFLCFCSFVSSAMAGVVSALDGRGVSGGCCRNAFAFRSKCFGHRGIMIFGGHGERWFRGLAGLSWSSVGISRSKVAASSRRTRMRRQAFWAICSTRSDSWRWLDPRTEQFLVELGVVFRVFAWDYQLLRSQVVLG